MVLLSDLNWSETWIISIYKNRLDCCDKLMTRVQTHGVGDAICENVLQILHIGAPQPRFWKGPRSADVSRDIGKCSASWWGLRECASMLIPELQESQRLFAQIDILHQKLIKIRSRDILICERVLGKWTPTFPGVEFWKSKIRFYRAGHKKKSAGTTNPICRGITLWCENEVCEKLGF